MVCQRRARPILFPTVLLRLVRRAPPQLQAARPMLQEQLRVASQATILAQVHAFRAQEILQRAQAPQLPSRYEFQEY